MTKDEILKRIEEASYCRCCDCDWLCISLKIAVEALDKIEYTSDCKFVVEITNEAIQKIGAPE